MLSKIVEALAGYAASLSVYIFSRLTNEPFISA